MTQTSLPETGYDLATTWQEAQKGNQTAWETVFKECYPKVRRVVRRKLNRSMRSLYDSTDFANDAMERLAANLDLLEFPSLSSLIAFLAQVAEQKVIDEYRRQHTLKHDVDRETADGGERRRSGPATFGRADGQPAGPGERVSRTAAGSSR